MDIPDADLRRARYGNRLRRERDAAGLSQREAADRIGVDHKIVTRAEQGHASEGVFVALEGVYGMVDPSPGAPKDPVRRIRWAAERAAALSAPRAPASGTFGKPARD
jgi:transcriptional regulator with XRE-family HTH domain